MKIKVTALLQRLLYNPSFLLTLKLSVIKFPKKKLMSKHSIKSLNTLLKIKNL